MKGKHIDKCCSKTIKIVRQHSHFCLYQQQLDCAEPLFFSSSACSSHLHRHLGRRLGESEIKWGEKRHFERKKCYKTEATAKLFFISSQRCWLNSFHRMNEYAPLCSMSLSDYLFVSRKHVTNSQQFMPKTGLTEQKSK